VGKISASMKRSFLVHLKNKVVDLEGIRKAKRMMEEALAEMESQKNKGLNEGGDPLHMLYTAAITMISSCVYPLMGLKEMKEFNKVILQQEDLYQPSYPPMSPITDSYYIQNELFDLQVGQDKETLSGIVLELVEVLNIPPAEVKIIKNLHNSKMSLYKLCKKSGDKVLLRELLTNEEHWAVCPAGYKGKIGQLWYIRLMPGLPQYCDYSLVNMTPYVVLSYGENDWLKFFKKNEVNKDNFHNFMKFGPQKNYWNEFVFWGYCNFTNEAIFISGLPDKKESWPCGDNFTEGNLLRESFYSMLLQSDKKKILSHQPASRG